VRPNDPNQPDIFLHATSMADGHTFFDLQIGSKVAYDLKPSRTKPGKFECVDVHILD
jgi:hypothetical protein